MTGWWSCDYRVPGQWPQHVFSVIVLFNGILFSIQEFGTFWNSSEAHAIMVSGKGQKTKGKIKLSYSSVHPCWLDFEDLPHPTKGLQRRCWCLRATASALYIITYPDSRPNPSPGSVCSVPLHWVASLGIPYLATRVHLLVCTRQARC